MPKLLIGSLVINFVILIDGCSSGLPKPVLPDGSHRVPINRVVRAPASPVSPEPATASTAGAGS